MSALTQLKWIEGVTQTRTDRKLADGATTIPCPIHQDAGSGQRLLIKCLVRQIRALERAQRPSYPKFEGKEGQEVTSWLKKLQAVATEKGESLGVETAVKTLKGKALQWCVNHVEFHGWFPDWDTFEWQVTQRFGGDRSPYWLRVCLDNTRQTGSISDYIINFQKAVGAVPEMHNADQVYRFIRGSRKDLRKELMKKDPRTLQTAFKIAWSYDAVNAPKNDSQSIGPQRRRRKKAVELHLKSESSLPLFE